VTILNQEGKGFMRNKHHYEIEFNTLSKSCFTYSYDYASNRGKDIKIRLSPNAIQIIADLSPIYNINDITNPGNLILSDSIKKSLLMHLLLFGKNISMKTVEFVIDNEREKLEIQSHRRIGIYSLINEKTSIIIPESWKKPIIAETLLSTAPSNQDSRWAALFAALFAKSRTFETERFIYFWMSFNGIYGYLAEIINGMKQSVSKRKPQEAKQLTWLLQFYGIGNEHVCQEDSASIAHEVKSILLENDISTIKGRKEIQNDLIENISKVVKRKNGVAYHTTTYGYLLVDFAYFFRCNLIHANKPLSLFSYAEEPDIVCLSLINKLLEEFIDLNLPHLFDCNYMKQECLQKLKELA